MLFGNDRNQIRQYFYEVWRKHNSGQPLQPLEKIIAGVINQHPEYHALLADSKIALERDYLPELGETNPFLHMGMHIAIQEQLATQRPAGILETYRLLCQRYGDSHQAEHYMMEVLGQTLWEAQRRGTPPDQDLYLQRLRQLVQNN